VIFEHVVAALVHGRGMSGSPALGCSDRTIWRRLAEWADLGLAEALDAAALRAYDQIIGLELGDVAVDGCLTKAPCGGERARPSPVDRRKGGLKRSVASDGYGIPLGIASAGANRHDSPRLAPTPQAASRQLPGPTAPAWTSRPAMTARLPGRLPAARVRAVLAAGRPPSQPGPGPAAGGRVRVPGSGPPMSSRNGGYLSVMSPA
jgi:hypothetical protein